MTLYEIINVVERIRMLDRVIVEKEATVADMQAALETEIGHKKTIARCRLREAEEALGAAIAEYDVLGASIPAPEELLYGYSVGCIADLRIKRGDLNKDAEAQRRLLDAEEEKLKSGPWRRKGAPLPPAILAIQLRIAEIEASIARLDANVVDMMKSIDQEEKMREEKRTFALWMADETGTVQPPAWVLEREKAEQEEILATATRLEILTPAVIARRCAEAKAAAERQAAEEAAAAALAAAAAAAAARRAARPKKQSIFEVLVAKYKARASVPELVVEG